MTDKNSGGLLDDDLTTEQDDAPFGGDLDEIEVNFVDDDDADQPVQARRGQNEDPDFFEGEASDDELDGASQSVKNRIMRERRIRMEETARLTGELEKAEEAILSSEIKSARAQRDSFKIGLDALDVRMQTAREALKHARTEEDRGAEVEIESHIRQIEKLRGEIEQNLARVPSDEAIQQAFQQHRERMKPMRQARGDTEDGRPLNGLAERWRNANAWMDDPAQAEAKKALVQVSQQIAREGLDPNSQEHFTELTRRMARSFPSLGVRDLAGRQLGSAPRGQPQSQRRASNPPPVGGNRGAIPVNNQNSKRNPKQVDLDTSDKRMMRAVGLDPTNKKVVAYYAKEKLGRIQRDAKGN